MLEVGFAFGFFVVLGIVAFLIGFIAEKSGRKTLTIILCMLLGLVIVLIGFWMENIWVFLSGAVIFIGPLFYLQGIVEEKARKKKEKKEKENKSDQDST